MKTYSAALLLHFSLQTLVAAEVPTFTQRDWRTYIGKEDPSKLGPNDILVTESDSVSVTFGSDFSSRLHKVLKSHCENPEDTACKDELKKTLGIGPTADGLQKRVVSALVATAGAVVAYIYYKIITYTWHSMDEEHFKAVKISIPHDQVNEISDWDMSEDKFNYKPEGLDPVEVDIDADQPKPSDNNTPTALKEKNGDITINVPGLDQAIHDSWKKVLCTRQARSLQKRITMQCLVQYAQAIMRIAQIGGDGAAIQYVTSFDFPQPKNQLLVEALEENKKYASKMYYGNGIPAQQRDHIYEFATWVAFGYGVGHYDIVEGKMRIPASFAIEQPDEGPKGPNCPDEYYTPFCSNCGGTFQSDLFSSISSQSEMGTCAGLDDQEDGYYKGCPCLLDDEIDEDGPTLAEIEAAFNFLVNLPEETGDEGNDFVEPSFKCYKTDRERMADHSNWKFAEQTKMDEAIETFCRDNWADVGTADPWTFERTFYDENDDWNHLEISITGKSGTKPSREKCKEILMHISKDCDHDPEPDVTKNINQYNWKWGGELVESNGIKWSVQPQKKRIGDLPEDESHGLVTDARRCYAQTKFSDHGNKGLNGKKLDDSAKMTLQQCIHRLRLFDGDKEDTCGGLLTLKTQRESYTDYLSCAENTWACLSYWVEKGQAARGYHVPGFAHCQADLFF